MNPRKRFGRLLREARERSRLSRAVLGMRIGVHWKTIQSWEDGRTFPEDLFVIPALERETGIDVARFFAGLSDESASTEPKTMGPVPVRLARQEKGVDDDDWLAVPLARLAKRTNVNAIQFKTLKHIVVPADWADGAQAKNLIAFKHQDRQMEPVVPHQALVVVNASARDDTRFRTGDLVAGFIDGRGVRIRYVEEERRPGKRVGRSYGLVPAEGGCGFFPIRPNRDRILGRVVGIIARPALRKRARSSSGHVEQGKRGVEGIGLKPSERCLTAMRLREEGRTQQEIAQVLGVSRQRVSQLLMRAAQSHGFEDPVSLTGGRYGHILTEQYLMEQYVHGCRSVESIADEVGVRPETVGEYMRYHGIPLGQGLLRGKLRKDVLQREYIERGRPQAEVAEVLGVSPSTVAKYLKRYGISKNDAGRR